MARKGLPKSIIKKYGITKKAWRVFRGKKSKSRSKTKTKTKRKRRVNPIARRKKKGGGKSLQRTVFKWLRVAALVAPGLHAATAPGKPMDKLDLAIYRYSGYSMKRGKWEPQALMQGYGPFLGTVLATYGIPKLASIIRKL